MLLLQEEHLCNYLCLIILARWKQYLSATQSRGHLLSEMPKVKLLDVVRDIVVVCSCSGVTKFFSSSFLF